MANIQSAAQHTPGRPLHISETPEYWRQAARRARDDIKDRWRTVEGMQILQREAEDYEQRAQKLAERIDFEAWYCSDAERQGMPLPDGIAHLREGNSYGAHRVMLNGKWEGWQARAAIAKATGSAA